jgi:CRISPR type IV-associated protein Csf1
MVTKRIIEAIEQKKYDDNFENICCLCGIEKSFKFTERKKILSNSFTDYNKMKYRDSNFVCGYCEKLLSGNYMDSPKGKKCGLRLYSFLVEKNIFKIIEKSEIEKYLFNYQFKIPYILCITELGKKHIAWKAIFGNCNNNITINTENGVLKLDRDKYLKIYLLCKKLYENEVLKDELKNRNISVKKIKNFVDNKIIDFKDLNYLKKFNNDFVFEFIINNLSKNK